VNRFRSRCYQIARLSADSGSMLKHVKRTTVAIGAIVMVFRLSLESLANADLDVLVH
jgi:hypothetical protein